jgi:L-ribulose-5-phosphate 4-epimerase
MNPYQTLKKEAYEANMELPRQRIVIYTFGNVSALDRNKGVYAIKPSGVPYSELKPDDMVIVDLENNVVDGDLKPSSDTKTHTVLYNHFPEINGIVHTHSAYAVAWAQAKRAIPIYGTTHADHLTDDVPCTAVMSDEMIQGDYEYATGMQIIETFENLNYREIEMVLVACHGPFTWGNTAQKAVYNAVVLEELARMALFTEQINPDITPLKQALKEKHYYRKHGKNAYYGQTK